MTTHPLPPMVSYYNDVLSISLQIPKGWTPQQLSEDKFAVTAPPLRAYEGHPTTFSYQVVLPDEYSLAWMETVIQESAEKQVAVYPNFQVVREEHFLLGGAHAYIRQMEWYFEPLDMVQLNMQGLLLANPMAFYIFKAATLKAFESDHIPLFETVFKSTRVILP